MPRKFQFVPTPSLRDTETKISIMYLEILFPTFPNKGTEVNYGKVGKCI